jgi:hypothetical protein
LLVKIQRKEGEEEGREEGEVKSTVLTLLSEQLHGTMEEGNVSLVGVGSTRKPSRSGERVFLLTSRKRENSYDGHTLPLLSWLTSGRAYAAVPYPPFYDQI